ncbi:MAG: HEAT repeat domain-containing protein [Planctomycetes bacterium]|nr:HEAT repeat domain-containing protein [Planctomycetota bacterium]
MLRFTVMIVGLALAGAASAQDDPKKAEKEAEASAKKRIEEFRTAVRKCRSNEDFVSALDGLGDQPHPLILAELKSWLAKPAPEVRQEAADEIGKFKNDEKAASALLSLARSDRLPDVAVKALKEVGDIGCKKVARNLTGFFSHREVDIAKEAIDTAGTLGSKDSIDPLITLVDQLELDKERGQNSSYSGGGPGASPPDGRTFPGQSNQNQQDERKKRAEDLLPRAIQALKDITGEKACNTAGEWKRWWAKNRAFFKDDKEEAQKKAD